MVKGDGGKKRMKLLQDLNQAFVIRQESGRRVPLNDLDCCLISIKELKIERYFTKNKLMKEKKEDQDCPNDYDSQRTGKNTSEHFSKKT